MKRALYAIPFDTSLPEDALPKDDKYLMLSSKVLVNFFDEEKREVVQEIMTEKEFEMLNRARTIKIYKVAP